MRTSAEAIYLDSSALVKLVTQEQESTELGEYLIGRPARFSSALARVEVIRAVRAHGQQRIARAHEALLDVELIRIDDAILDRAAELDPLVLRSFAAIHLASALTLGSNLQAIVTYDDRMTRAAEALGLPLASPGRPRR